MIGWMIVAIAVLLIGVIGHFCGNEWGDDMWLLLRVLGYVLGIISIIIILVTNIETKKEINTFKNYQELVEITYSDEEETLNYAMNIKIIEMNEWLNEARVCEEMYGIFSFYRNRLDNLEYIEIGD